MLNDFFLNFRMFEIAYFWFQGHTNDTANGYASAQQQNQS